MRGRRHILALAWTAGGILISGLLVLAGISASRASAQARAVPGQVRTDQVLADPRSYLSHTVTIDAEVARVWDGRALALRSHSIRQGLLVVLGREGAQMEVPLREGLRVQVLGTVRLMNRQEALALGMDPAHDDLPAIYRDDPYLLALQITPGAGP